MSLNLTRARLVFILSMYVWASGVSFRKHHCMPQFPWLIAHSFLWIALQFALFLLGTSHDRSFSMDVMDYLNFVPMNVWTVKEGDATEASSECDSKGETLMLLQLMMDIDTGKKISEFQISSFPKWPCPFDFHGRQKRAFRNAEFAVPAFRPVSFDSDGDQLGAVSAQFRGQNKGSIFCFPSRRTLQLLYISRRE